MAVSKIKFHKKGNGCIEEGVNELGLMEVKKEDIVIYVEKNPTDVAVAEIVPEEIASKESMEIWKWTRLREERE